MSVDPNIFGLQGFAFPIGSASSIAVPTLAVADAADDPTGATATITGSTAGATNTVSYQTVRNAQHWDPTAWMAGNSRTGDGTIVFTLPAGYYWFKVDSVLNGQTAVSNLVYRAITDGQDAVHERCLLAFEAGLETLIGSNVIPGITSGARIYDQIELAIENATLPALFVCTNLPGQTSTEQLLGGSNLRDDLGYPVYVVLLDRASGQYVAGRAGYLKARQVISRYFRQQRLPDVSEVYEVRLDSNPGPILRIETAQFEIIGSVLVWRCLTREPRGA